MRVNENLLRRTQAFFAEDGGLLASANLQYRVRPGQIAMALAVADAIADSKALVVEAGTGVGKTYAYLVPALLSGERVLVSTATKALQDQLFGRDLPYLRDLLGVPLRLALLKGRASYVCLHRLDLARHDVTLADRQQHHALARIERFVQSSASGDLAELEGLDERSPVLPLVTSTRENCLGGQCPEFKRCFVNQARREALAADVAVVNHHLFFADLAVRESGMAELLPSVHTVIFDEAHQLNEIGVQFMGKQLATSHLLDFCRDVLASGLQLARGLADWQECCRHLEQAARELRLVGGKWPPGSKLRWTQAAPEGVDFDEWRLVLLALQGALQQVLLALDTVSELSPDFVRLLQRGQALEQRAAMFLDAAPESTVRWLEVGAVLRLVQTPLDIADTVQHKMLRVEGAADAAGAALPHNDADAGAMASIAPLPTGVHPCGHDDEVPGEEATIPDPPEIPHKAWIFTSATLGEDATLRWFTEPCGLQHVPALQVGSPFDYAAHAALYVPQMVLPNDPGHPAAVCGLVGPAARRLGGRTLVLTTTLRNLRSIGDGLRQAYAADPGAPEVLVQGESTKRRLMERFRQGDGTAQANGCVLVASASFWEGIDVPGDALQLLVIDKLPFPPPNDPLVEARSRRLQRAGKSPFTEYHLPEAAVMLKQGAGRLIRCETDTGILVVCDSRLRQMGYGRRLLKALPPMQRLQDEADFLRQIEWLAAPRGLCGGAPDHKTAPQ